MWEKHCKSQRLGGHRGTVSSRRNRTTALTNSLLCAEDLLRTKPLTQNYSSWHSWWLLGKDKPVFFKGVIPGSFTMLQWMILYPWAAQIGHRSRWIWEELEGIIGGRLWSKYTVCMQEILKVIKMYKNYWNYDNYLGIITKFCRLIILYLFQQTSVFKTLT